MLTMTYLISKLKKYIINEYVFLGIVQSFAFFSLAGFFLVNQSLTHDVLFLFNFFRDNLHALNFFGEIAWWNPNINGNGFPSYYFTILGDNFNSPLFAVLAFCYWLLGQAEIRPESYHTVWLVYNTLIVPVLFSLSLLIFVKQFIKNKLVLRYVIILSAFSPGMVFSLTDRGLEHTAYSLLFALAWLKFIEKPTRHSFLLVSLTVLVLAVSFSHLALYWNVPFIAMYVMATLFVNKKGILSKITRSVPFYYWICLTAAVVICLSPTLLTIQHGNEIMRVASIKSPKVVNILNQTQGGRIYPYSWLQPGNPLEFLTVSTSAVGFLWDGAHYKPFRAMGHYVAYNYLGLLALPLTITGLCFGRPIWRKRLFVLLVISSCIVLLSGYSPIFSVILAWPSPLRSVRHFSDVFFRVGGFYFIILSSALGLDVIVRWAKYRFWKPFILISFLISILLSGILLTSIQAIGNGGQVVTSSLLSDVTFNVYAVIAFFMVVLLLYSALHKNNSSLAKYLLLLIFIDVSTSAFLYVRKTPYISDRHDFSEPTISQIGFPLEKDILRLPGTTTISNKPYLKLSDLVTTKYDWSHDTDDEYLLGNESGNWEVKKGLYQSSITKRNPGSYSRVPLQQDFRDGEIEVDVQPFLDGGIWLRSDYNNGQINGILLAAGKKYLYWHTVINGEFGLQKDRTLVSELGQGAVKITIVALENHYYVYVNDSPEPVMQFVDETFERGDLALFAVSSIPKFSTLKVNPYSTSDINILRQTYNTLSLEINALDDSVLLWGDVYFPFWKVSINDEKSEVLKIRHGIGKGVRVPKGKSIVKFTFKPPYVFELYLLSYLTIFWVLFCMTIKKLNITWIFKRKNRLII
jgi:hypothetical protein